MLNYRPTLEKTLCFIHDYRQVKNQPPDYERSADCLPLKTSELLHTLHYYLTTARLVP